MSIEQKTYKLLFTGRGELRCRPLGTYCVVGIWQYYTQSIVLCILLCACFSSPFITTEALKGHRVVWKIEIYYLIRMT